MTPKLIAIDVDDTLLNSTGILLPSTKKIVAKCLQNNIKVVLCSGRPLAGVKPFLDELGINAADQYVITYNGSVIESVTGEVISSHELSNSIYRAIDEFSKANHVAYDVLDRDSVIYTSNLDINRFTVVQAWENQAGLFIKTPEQLPNDFTITKGLFVGETDELNQVENAVRTAFEEQCYVVRAADNFLEVMHKNVNKGAALKTLSEKLGIAPTEIIALGDEQNDIPMFDFVGTAVAMANGSDLAKAHADFVTNSNDQDGIKNALEKLVFN
jgi:Cof subfamily protein (haloacid dehalogenase superfamily)